jgi:hypothetical protein
MFSESQFCCFVVPGGKGERRLPSGELRASERVRQCAPRNSETLKVGEWLADQTSLESRSDADHCDMLSVHSFGSRTPRSLCSSYTNQKYSGESGGERSGSCLHVMPPSNGLPLTTEVKGAQRLYKKTELLSVQFLHSALGQEPASTGCFVPEMSEMARRKHIALGSNSDESTLRPLMEGWTEEDQARFLAALRTIGSPLGRRTELGFHKWMVAVAAEVRCHTRASWPSSVYAMPAEWI